MKTQFTSIAMRCTQEQFDAIKPKLEKHGLKAEDLSRFSTMPYLINYRFKQINSITNYSEHHDWKKDLGINHVYRNWDENVFLQACGIDVDTYSVSKGFILEAHESACSTWKAKIEAQFPELFPKLEIGRWLKDDLSPEWLMYRDGKNIYGFDTYGDWFYRENGSYEPMSRDRYATDEEVQTALIAEAKRRGYKEGVNIKNLLANSIITCVGKSFLYQNNELWFNHIGCILKNGKWAEIIPETVELSLEDIAEKFGVDVSQIKIKS